MCLTRERDVLLLSLRSSVDGVTEDAGAELLTVPAAWFAGEHKVDHWQALLKARAIENTVWVAAADTCSEHTVGRSAVLDPLGVVVAEAGEDETVLTADVITGG